MRNNIEFFLNLSYNNETVKYLMAGIITEKKFSGYIYGHLSGEGSISVIFKNKLLPSCVEFEENCSLLEKLLINPLLIKEIDRELEGCIYSSETKELNLSKLLKAGLSSEHTLNTEGFEEFTPFDYGNTSFLNPLSSWSRDEINEILKKQLENNLKHKYNKIQE